jgi:hypothetical protein
MKRNEPVKIGRQASRPVLHLTLHREFFDAIAEGSKKTEYRDNTPYWRSRLADREYAEIVFRNGYATRAPLMRVQLLGIRKDKPDRFAIRLGKILETKNYRQRNR